MRYRLLRNNTERGPYSLEELLEQKLTPKDLIWVEGESTSWKFWDEVPSIVAVMPSNTEVKPAKKKYRVTADRQVIEIPDESNDSTSGRAIPKGETSFDEIEKRIQPQTPHGLSSTNQQADTSLQPALNDDTDAENTTPVANDDITKNNSGSNAGAFALAGLLFLIAVGWFGYRWYTESEEASLTDGDSAITDSASSGNDESLRNSQNISIQDDTTGTADRIQQARDQYILDSTNRALQEEQARKQAALAMEEQKRAAADNDIDDLDSLEAPHHSSKKHIETTSVNPTKSSIISGTAFSAKNIHVGLSTPPAKGIQNVTLWVKNNNMEKVRSVKINISYYDGKGNFLHKESIMAENIGGNESARVKIPANAAAATIAYKVAEVREN